MKTLQPGRIRRSASLGALGAMALLSGVVALVAPSPLAGAVAAPPDLVVDSNGQPPGTVANGTSLSVVARTPMPAGDVTQVIESLWEPGTATLDPASIVAPEGFALEYRTGTSTWSASVPTPASSITGLRATGTVESLGYASSTQVSQTLPTGALAPGGGSFQGQSGGDGWDVSFNHPNYDKVLNVWHHFSSVYLDCHVRATGASCWPSLSAVAPTSNVVTGVYRIDGYSSSNKSGAASWNDKVYLFTKSNTAPHPAGMLCIDVSGALPATCGFTTLIANTGSVSVDSFGETLQIGSKLYGFDMSTDRLTCFDAAQGRACDNQPYDLGVTGTTTFDTYLEVSGTKVFVAGVGALGCVDSTTDARCFDALTMTSTGVPIGADGSGGACYLDAGGRSGGDCVTGAGVQYARPAVLSSLLTSYPIGGLHASYGSVATNEVTNRLYWAAEGDIAPTLKNVACFDFTTGAACSGYTVQRVVSGKLYALVVDPLNPRCMWGNGDNGQITAFNALTGTSGCATSSPEMVYPYTETVPRLACGASSRVTGWRSMTVVLPNGMVAADSKISISDSSGLPITGWTEVPATAVAGSVTVSGQTIVFDLSTLTVAQTGLQPEFRVITPAGTTNTDAQAVDVNVAYESSVPELCFDLTTVAVCPTGVGVAASATPPAVDPEIRTVSYQGIGGSTTSASAQETLTMAPIANCLGTVQGQAVDAQSQPVAGIPVGLYAGSTLLASGQTAADGYATFADVYPFAAQALELRFEPLGYWVPMDSAPATLSALTATATVSAQKVFRLLPPPPPPSTSAPATSAPTTTEPSAPSTTEPTPTTEPGSGSTVPTTTPVPVADPTSGSLPELPRGESMAMEDGVPVPVVVEVLPTGNGLVMQGPDFEMQLAGESGGRVLPSTGDGVLRLVNGGSAMVNGFGFKPGTWVDVWLFSEPRYLGSLLVKADGTFDGELPIPPDVPVGGHTLQANGTTVLDTPRSLNLGVDLVASMPSGQLPATGGGALQQMALSLFVLSTGALALLLARRRRLV